MEKLGMYMGRQGNELRPMHMVEYTISKKMTRIIIEPGKRILLKNRISLSG